MEWFESVKEGVFDVLFPPRCVVCESTGSWWCEMCRTSLQVCPTNICPSCLKAGSHECARSGALDGLVSTGWYHDQKIRNMITALKYRGATCLFPAVTQHIVDWRESRLGAWPWAGEQRVVIQPIPAAPSRVRSRGFDQAELIANIIQTELVPWGTIGHVLERHDEDRLPQASLEPGPLRNANVQDLFYCTRIDSECVLLVDDVYTTGSTMQEAARILKKAGAKRVFGFVLAVGK